MDNCNTPNFLTNKRKERRGVVLQFLKDEGAFGKMWNLSLYKKGSPTLKTHSSFHFSIERERKRKREK